MEKKTRSRRARDKPTIRRTDFIDRNTLYNNKGI